MSSRKETKREWDEDDKDTSNSNKKKRGITTIPCFFPKSASKEPAVRSIAITPSQRDFSCVDLTTIGDEDSIEGEDGDDLEEEVLYNFTQKFSQIEGGGWDNNEDEDDGSIDMYDRSTDLTQEDCRKPSTKFHRDNDQQRSITVGMEERIFKVGERFQSTLKIHEDKIFKIREFSNKPGLQKVANCEVYKHLRKTIVEDQSKLVAKWDYILCKIPENIRLRHLDKRYFAPVPENPPLCWEENEKKNRVVGFNVAYLDMLQPSIDMEANKRPTVLELFAGAGGMSLGLKQAGFDVKFAVENNEDACNSLKMNHPNVTVFPEDVNKFIEKIRKESPAYQLRGKVNHIHSSSPCKGFSRANRTGGKNDKKHNDLTFSFVECIRLLNPDTASMENVTGMYDDKNKYYPNKVVADLINIGYQVRVTFLDSSDYGDPQSRVRVVIFATRIGFSYLPLLPPPTHGDNGLKPKLTARDALKELETLEPDTEPGVLMLDRKNGESEYIYDHNYQRRKLRGEKTKLDKNKPACTIKCGGAIEHYAFERELTIRELARLQGFPDSYKFSGSLTQQRNQIGNAVPVKLARAVAESIRKRCYPFCPVTVAT